MEVCWISAGVSSFIAGYLRKETVDKFLYIHIDDQHEDSLRFIKDCERVLGKEIEIIQSRYKNVDNIINMNRSINTPYGAPCTSYLKRRVRKEWEHGKGRLTYIWGYDNTEKQRADRLEESFSEHNHIFPLIDNNLSKEDCHGILKRLGIKRPIMYDLGYRNNNCIGCVKGGMGYWNKIRVDFPQVFEKRAKQEREIGRTCLTEKIEGKTTPLFLDELDPNRGRFENEILEDCGITCKGFI